VSDGSRRVGVQVPSPACPTSQFSTIKRGMFREVGRGVWVVVFGKRKHGEPLRLAV
jgi:hypothetical protein